MLRDTGLMACVRASRTPNPNAMKFTLDVTLSERILAVVCDEYDVSQGDGLMRVRMVKRAGA